MHLLELGAFWLTNFPRLTTKAASLNAPFGARYFLTKASANKLSADKRES